MALPPLAGKVPDLGCEWVLRTPNLGLFSLKPVDPKKSTVKISRTETFRVLREKEIRLYGEHPTRRLVLEARDKLEGVEVNSYTGKQVASEREDGDGV
jgi:hypothetical protein